MVLCECIQFLIDLSLTLWDKKVIYCFRSYLHKNVLIQAKYLKLCLFKNSATLTKSLTKLIYKESLLIFFFYFNILKQTNKKHLKKGGHSIKRCLGGRELTWCICASAERPRVCSFVPFPVFQHSSPSQQVPTISGLCWN